MIDPLPFNAIIMTNKQDKQQTLQWSDMNPLHLEKLISEE